MASATSICKKDLVEFLKTNPTEILQEADRVREEYCGSEVHIRGIIEFSNFCFKNCLYCGLRRSNSAISRYRMPEDVIMRHAERIIEAGIKTIVLQSGDDDLFSGRELSGIIRKIKKKWDVAVTLSVGERKFDDYRAFADAGADRFLIKHETANEKNYALLHPGQNLKHRLKILDFLKNLGFQTGAGFIVGLPGQTLDDIADDILLIKKIGCDMAGIGPFLPAKNTPLAHLPSGDFNLTLTAIALTRIITRNTHLPATTAMASLHPNGQLEALKSGCNVIMPDFTQERFSRMYKIYDNKARVTLEKAEKLIKLAGRTRSVTRGDSLKDARHS